MQRHVIFWSSSITRLILGIVPMGFFPRTPSCTSLSFVNAPAPLTGHSDHLHTLHVFVGTRGLASCKTCHYLQPTLPTACLRVSVTLCALIRFICFHSHKVPEGLPLYILRRRSGRTDGRDVYGVIRCVPLIVVLGVGIQLPRRPVMTRRPNAGPGGGCYLFPSKFVPVKVG